MMIEASFPLSPMQQSILIHSLYEQKLDGYIEQLICSLHENLNVSAFVQSWRQVTERHAILRTSFHGQGTEQFIQTVHTQVLLPLEQQNWCGLSDLEQNNQLQAYLDDRQHGFDLQVAPLMRLAFFQLAQANYKLIWTFHDALLDRPSAVLILQEVFAFYEALCQGKNLHLKAPRPFPIRQVTEWSELSKGEILFNSVLVFENYELNAAVRLQDGSWEHRDFQLLEQTNYPLTLRVYGDLQLLLYDDRRFEQDAIARMLGHLATLLEGMATDPQMRLCDFPLLTAAERHQLLVEWNNTQVDYPKDKCIHQIFEQQVEKTPKIAHFSSFFYVTYAQEIPYEGLLFYLLREKGVHIWEHRPCFFTLAHSDADIEFVTKAFKESVAELQANELRSFLKQKLPDYMVPTAFVLLDSLTLTPNGKVDRKALPLQDDFHSELEEHYQAPRTVIEQQIADIWTQVLNCKRIDIDDNFFELGGHSILAIQVISRLRQTFKVEISVRTLFEKPTIAYLAEHLETSGCVAVAKLSQNNMMSDYEEGEL